MEEPLGLSVFAVKAVQAFLYIAMTAFEDQRENEETGWSIQSEQ